jgi:hypothetical protein
MQRFKIDLVINDSFHLFANNEQEARTEALNRIKLGEFPFDDKHPLRFTDFQIQSIKGA